MLWSSRGLVGSSRGLVDRALDLKPEITQGCGFKSRLWQEVSTTEVRPLSNALIPQNCRTVGSPLLQFGWVKCREHISLLIILCTVVYVTNKAHLSLICIFIAEVEVDFYCFSEVGVFGRQAWNVWVLFGEED